MKKWSILSRHIVLPEAKIPSENLPTYGLVLVEDEVIADVVILSTDVPVTPNQVDEALRRFEAWNPINLEDYYISPGVIDCNVRGNGEWETPEEMTLAAVSGGVTLVIRENSIYGQNESIGACYCDVGRVSRVDDLPTILSPFAYKVYLYPPSAYVPGHAEDLESVFQALSDVRRPVIVDVEMPQERWLQASSPYRRRPLSDRVEGLVAHTPASSGAYQKDIEDTDSSPDVPEAAETETEDTKESKDDRHLHTRRFPAITVIIEEGTKERSMSFKRSDKRKRSLPTVMMDLRKRIYKHGQSVAELSKAEMKEYESSGKTTFSPEIVAASGTRKRSSSFMTPLLRAFMNTESPPDLSPVVLPPADFSTPQVDRLGSRRPQPLVISKPDVRTMENDYLNYLVNCPDHWELDGVRVALRALKKCKRQVHFANLSAATAVNRILRRPIPGVTTETCIHHLFFSMEEVKPGETQFKTFPPIRNKTNCNLLWELLKVNGITLISSQHIAVPPALKFGGSFPRAVPGISGVGQGMQAVWTKLRTPAIDSVLVQEKYLVRLAKWMSLNPAKMLGVADRRGSIESGKYADLVVWAPFEKSGLGFVKYLQVCPYQGKDLYGRVHAVYVRGQLAFQSGRSFPVGSLVSPN